MIFVGARSITEDRVFLLRAYDKAHEQDATIAYTKLTAVYSGSPGEVELLFGTYESPDRFFAAEPTWDVQFSGDRQFANGVGV